MPTFLLDGFILRKQIALGPWGIGLGLALFLGATVICARNVAVDQRVLATPPRRPTGAEHGIAVHPETPEVDTSPVGPANYFQQLRGLRGRRPRLGGRRLRLAAVCTTSRPAAPRSRAIRAYLNDLLKGHRSLKVDVQRMGVDGDNAIVEWTWSFRRQPPSPTSPAPPSSRSWPSPTTGITSRDAWPQPTRPSRPSPPPRSRVWPPADLAVLVVVAVVLPAAPALLDHRQPTAG